MIRLALEQSSRGDSGVILIRSKLRAISMRMGFADVVRERMELVCTEMLSNQQKYARGSGLMQIWESSLPTPALDLFAIDYGPGIGDLGEAVADGFTTSGTLGHGLGTISRLSDDYGFFSLPDVHAVERPWHGTAVWARFSLDRSACLCGCQVGAFLRPYQDAPQNGDCIRVHCRGKALRWLHLDGLGHGEEAARAVQGVEDLVADDHSLVGGLEAVSRALHGTRGAVGIMGELDPLANEARICGVGDMMAATVGEEGRQNIPFAPGVLGHLHRSFERHDLLLGEQQLVITASDGLRRNWEVAIFAGLWRLHPQMIALFLGNVVGRNNDDKSVFVIRSKNTQHVNH